MPFVTIKGSFHLCGQSAKGNPTGFQPDGDSMQFKPRRRVAARPAGTHGDAYRLTSIGSTQLRFEGIDALELHFEGHHQPRPLADDSRDDLTGLLGMNPVPYAPPKNVTVKPPVPTTARGATSSRAHLRRTGGKWRSHSPATQPATTAIGDVPRAAPPQEPELQGARDRQRLPAVLRHAVRRSARRSRPQRRTHDLPGRDCGSYDRPTKGLAATNEADLEAQGVVFPEAVPPLDELLRRRRQVARRASCPGSRRPRSRSST